MQSSLITYCLTLLALIHSIPAMGSAKLFSKDIQEIKIGSGITISEGDMLSIKISSQTLSDNASLHPAVADGYEVVFAGKDSRSYLNEAILGINHLGPMRCGGIRSINTQAHTNGQQTTIRHSIEVASILHHFPTPSIN